MTNRERLALSWICLTVAILVSPSCSSAKPPPVDIKDWQFTVQVPSLEAGNNGPVGYLWLPESVKNVRGLIFAGRTVIERMFCVDPIIRQAAAREHMGILYFEPALDALFNYTNKTSVKNLEYALEELAKKSGHPELQFVPWITVGHSTGGIFCRNVAYWNPDRVIGVIHIKSGNFQANICDPTKSLAGVPFLAINGEFEEYGPDGGDLPKGLRSEYSLNADNKTNQNQTQWIMVRQQILDRRLRNPNNLMSLVIHRGQSHMTWDADMSKLCAQFIHSAAVARIPKDAPTDKPVVCNPLKVENGWLSDADIKNPKNKTEPYAEYKGDKNLTFLHVDQAMAKAVDAYLKGPWSVPDPTDGQPIAKRFYPPPELKDTVDAKP